MKPDRNYPLSKKKVDPTGISGNHEAFLSIKPSINATRVYRSQIIKTLKFQHWLAGPEKCKPRRAYVLWCFCITFIFKHVQAFDGWRGLPIAITQYRLQSDTISNKRDKLEGLKRIQTWRLPLHLAQAWTGPRHSPVTNALGARAY